MYSGIYGDVVVYNPAAKGGFVDGQEAINSTPAGGTLWITGDWNTAVDGRIVRTDAPIHLRGSASHKSGVTITNGTGAPAIEFNNTVTHWGWSIKDLRIQHLNNPNAYAIECDHLVYVDLINLNIQADGSKGACLFDNDTFGVRMQRVQVRHFLEYGVYFTGGGGSNQLDHCWITSTHNNTGLASVYTKQQITVHDGQLDCVGAPPGGTGIVVDTARGGYLTGTWCEGGLWAMEFKNGAQNFRIENPRWTMNDAVPYTSRLQGGILATHCEGIILNDYICLEPANGGTLAEFGNNCNDCMINVQNYNLLDARTKVSVRAGETPTNCVVRVPSATDADINNWTIDHAVRVEVGYNATKRGPVFRELGTWYRIPQTTFVPCPGT